MNTAVQSHDLYYNRTQRAVGGVANGNGSYDRGEIPHLYWRRPIKRRTFPAEGL